MRLRRLRLAHFRNHQGTDVTLSPGATVFVGANAQGKTSLLEAVYLASTGRSFRAQRDAEVIAFGDLWARVRAVVLRADREEEIDVALRREEAIEGRAAREIRINGVPVRRGELFGHLLCVAAAPADGEVITGPPLHRRRLLDLLLAQISPAYFYVLQRYARVLAQRNRLLRLGSGRGLEAWDEQIATVGATITARRRGLAGRLAEAAGPIYKRLSGDRESLQVHFAPSLLGDDEAAMLAHARAMLPARRGEELARGGTVVGPHRDDLRVHVEGRELRTYGSRGQQVSAMLAIRLAERRVLREETGEEPILLLDDVLLTLDEARQAYLLECIQGVQALLTSTTLTTRVRLPEGAMMFRVQAGTVEAGHVHLA